MPVRRLLFATVMLCGCETPLEPSGFVGTYTLHAANGAALPFTSLSADSSCSWTVSEGLLTLGAGAFALSLNTTQFCAPVVEPGGWQWLGGGLTIEGPRTLDLHIVSDPSGATRVLRVRLDDSTATLGISMGQFGAFAPVALRFGARTTAVGTTGASRPNHGL